MTSSELPPQPTFFVVNMCSRWDKRAILRGQKPTMIQPSLADAYKEAKRLAEKHTQGDFAVFECIGRCKSLPK